MTKGWIERWKNQRREIERYSTMERQTFYCLALKYLKEGPVTVIDVGCGFSRFAEQAKVTNPEATIYSIDGNPETVEALNKQGCNAIRYQAPDCLPFKDKEVGYIHCSHLIEHLHPQDLYLLLQEFNRVLDNDGILVVSAPILWEGFYQDLSHIRPYPSTVLDKYLTSTIDTISSTRSYIRQFNREALYIRYEKKSTFNKLGLRSEHWLFDLIILGCKKIAIKTGIYRLSETGYTSIYRKL